MLKHTNQMIMNDKNVKYRDHEWSQLNIFLIHLFEWNFICSHNFDKFTLVQPFELMLPCHFVKCSKTKFFVGTVLFLKNKMHLEHIFLKYIPMFNWLGESCVMTTDFQLTSSSFKRRRIFTYFSICISMFLMSILTIFNIVMYIKYFSDAGNVKLIVMVVIFTSRMAGKLASMSQLNSWLNYLPKVYILCKDIQHVSESRYKMNFCRFQIQFEKEMSIIFGLWLVKLSIYFVVNSVSSLRCVMTINESGVVFLSHIILFHAYFYILLFKHIIFFYIGYVKRKASFDKPKTLSELKIELVFIKVINFKLYEISKVLNAAFGWVFVLMAIQKFAEIIGDIFWIVSNIKCENALTTIRNY